MKDNTLSKMHPNNKPSGDNKSRRGNNLQARAYSP